MPQNPDESPIIQFFRNLMATVSQGVTPETGAGADAARSALSLVAPSRGVPIRLPRLSGVPVPRPTVAKPRVYLRSSASLVSGRNKKLATPFGTGHIGPGR